MTDKVDQRFQDLLRRAGPAERDPAFRLRVLEQRERERFVQPAGRSFMRRSLLSTMSPTAT